MTENENPYASPAASPSSPESPSTPPAAEAPTPPIPESPAEGLVTDNNARMFGMLCHLCALAGLVGVPFGNILGPLVIWLIKKNEIPFVDEQGKESLNFQITVAIAIAICIPLCFIVIGIFLMIAVGIASLVFVIIAAVKSNSGEHYRYPISIRFIK